MVSSLRSAAEAGGHAGNRVELEAIDQKVRRGKEPAPYAMAEAKQEVRNWRQGGKPPRISPFKKV